MLEKEYKERKKEKPSAFCPSCKKEAEELMVKGICWIKMRWCAELDRYIFSHFDSKEEDLACYCDVCGAEVKWKSSI